ISPRPAHPLFPSATLFRSEAGVEAGDDLVEEGGEQVAGGTEAATRLVERRADLTAIFCHHDLAALGVMAALRSAGRRIPGDCSRSEEHTSELQSRVELV